MSEIITQESLSKDQIAELRQLAMGNLFFFAKGILGFDWLDPQIHLPLCHLLELYDGWDESLGFEKDVYVKTLRDKHLRLLEEKIEESLEEGIRQLLIELPRGWLKTTLCSISYPLWRGVRDPNVRCLLTQNTHSNALAKFSSIAGKVLGQGSLMFQTIFPDIVPTKNETWRADSLCLHRDKAWAESTFEAAGTKTQVTSRHFGLIIEDDTVAPDKEDLGFDNLLPSQDDVEQAIGYHRLVPPLLIDVEKSQNLVVGTRWFQRDLISWVEENEPWFVVYKRAALENEKGEADEKGEPAYPSRFSRSALEKLKARMGPYLYSCLYLNKPIRSDDMIFRQEWFKYFEKEPQNLVCYTTVDPAGDPKESKGETDWSAVITCGKDLTTGNIYVLESSRVKCDPGDLIDLLFRHVRKYMPVKVGVESVAYQSSLLYWIREKQKQDSTFFLVEKLKGSTTKKELRVQGLQPVIASGTLKFRPHQQDLISELLVFPYGKNDDLADALAYQLQLWGLTRGAVSGGRAVIYDPWSVNNIVEEYKQELRKESKDKARPVKRSFIGISHDLESKSSRKVQSWHLDHQTLLN